VVPRYVQQTAFKQFDSLQHKFYPPKMKVQCTPVLLAIIISHMMHNNRNCNSVECVIYVPVNDACSEFFANIMIHCFQTWFTFSGLAYTNNEVFRGFEPPFLNFNGWVCLAFTQTHAWRLYFLLTETIIPFFCTKVGVV